MQIWDSTVPPHDDGMNLAQFEQALKLVALLQVEIAPCQSLKACPWRNCLDVFMADFSQTSLCAMKSSN